MKSLLPTLGVLSLAATVSAQVGSLATNNASFDLYSIPAGPTEDAPRIRFTGDPGTTSSAAFSFWWFYRVVGDTRETTFNSSGGQITQTTFTSPKRGQIKWTNVDGRGFDANYIITIQDDSPTSAVNSHMMTLRNNTASPLQIELFAYADIDECGTASGDTASGTTGSHLVVDASCGGPGTEFGGIGATNYLVGSWPTVLDTLVDGAAADLPNTGLPYSLPAGGDYTGAMQFSLTIAPGEIGHALAAISHGTTLPNCGAVASSVSFGVPTPGAGGAPLIYADTLPVVSSAAELVMENMPPGASIVLLYGSQPLVFPTGVPVFGITLYVTPLGTSPLVADANGERRLLLPLPLQSVGICNQNFYFQTLVADPTSGTAFGLSQSAALQWLIGQ